MTSANSLCCKHRAFVLRKRAIAQRMTSLHHSMQTASTTRDEIRFLASEARHCRSVNSLDRVGAFMGPTYHSPGVTSDHAPELPRRQLHALES